MQDLRILAPLATFILALASSRAIGDQISITTDCLRVPSYAVADGAPAGGHALRFFVTTDGDMLSVNNVQIQLPSGVALYNHPLGDPSNANPPNPGLLPVFPAISVDSWITTPGHTTRLGPDLPGDGTTTFGDITNDGPVINFQFAQLTIPMDATFLNFSGRMNIAGSGGSTVYSQEFLLPTPLTFPDHVCIPEPAALALAMLGLAGFAARRRKAA